MRKKKELRNKKTNKEENFLRLTRISKEKIIFLNLDKTYSIKMKSMKQMKKKKERSSVILLNKSNPILMKDQTIMTSISIVQ